MTDLILSRVVEDYRVAIAADVPQGESLSWDKVSKWLRVAARAMVRSAESLFGPGTGEQKKAAVMAALKALYDLLCGAWDVPYLPSMFERTIEHAAWCVIEPFAAGFVESAVDLLHAEQRAGMVPGTEGHS